MKVGEQHVGRCERAGHCADGVGGEKTSGDVARSPSVPLGFTTGTNEERRKNRGSGNQGGACGGRAKKKGTWHVSGRLFSTDEIREAAGRCHEQGREDDESNSREACGARNENRGRHSPLRERNEDRAHSQREQGRDQDCAKREGRLIEHTPEGLVKKELSGKYAESGSEGDECSVEPRPRAARFPRGSLR